MQAPHHEITSRVVFHCSIIISDFDYYVLHWIKRTAAEFTVYGRELENV
jgi:hypothetical protein